MLTKKLRAKSDEVCDAIAASFRGLGRGFQAPETVVTSAWGFPRQRDLINSGDSSSAFPHEQLRQEAKSYELLAFQRS